MHFFGILSGVCVAQSSGRCGAHNFFKIVRRCSVRHCQTIVHAHDLLVLSLLSLCGSRSSATDDRPGARGLHRLVVTIPCYSTPILISVTAPQRLTVCACVRFVTKIRFVGYSAPPIRTAIGCVETLPDTDGNGVVWVTIICRYA